MERCAIVVWLFLHKGFERVEPGDDVGPEALKIRTPFDKATQHPILGVATRKCVNGARTKRVEVEGGAVTIADGARIDGCPTNANSRGRGGADGVRNGVPSEARRASRGKGFLSSPQDPLPGNPRVPES